MELDELHVDQLRAGVVTERMSVARVFPTVARDFVGAPDPAGRQDDRFRAENHEPAALAIVTKRADDAVPFLEERQNRPFHVNVDPLMHAVVLERPNHFQSGPLAADASIAARKPAPPAPITRTSC